MSVSVANVHTENASRYLQQLCKHWSHKYSVKFTPVEGQIDFGDGTLVGLSADSPALTITIEAPACADFRKLERVVEDHISRFAFRENLRFEWT